MQRADLFRRLIGATRPDHLLRIAAEQCASLAGRYGEPGERLARASRVVIYGAGLYGRQVHAAWNGRVSGLMGFVDSDRTKWRTSWRGLAIRDPDALSSDWSDCLVVVAAMETHGITERLRPLDVQTLYAERDGSVGEIPGHWLLRQHNLLQDLYEQLADDTSRRVLLETVKARMFQEFHFPMKGNWFTANCASTPQYFPPDILSQCDAETFIDCGAFDGDTTIDFFANSWRAGARECKALAIEADEANVRTTRRNLDEYGLRDVLVLHRTLGLQHESIHHCRDNSLPRLGAPLRLDDLELPRSPLYLKMDIEGAELETLQEAARLIESRQPRIAVCTYHSTRDLLRIPRHLLERHPDYRLFLRHHRAGSLWETVCYAMPRSAA
jgi:hypothetical protein